MNLWKRDRLSLLRFFGWKASETYQTAVVTSKTRLDCHLQSFLEHVRFTTKDERTETKAADRPSSPSCAPTFALGAADFAAEVETLSSHFQRALLDPQVGFLAAKSKNSSKYVSHGFHTIFFHFLRRLCSFLSWLVFQRLFIQHRNVLDE